MFLLTAENETPLVTVGAEGEFCDLLNDEGHFHNFYSQYLNIHDITSRLSVDVINDHLSVFLEPAEGSRKSLRIIFFASACSDMGQGAICTEERSFAPNPHRLGTTTFLSMGELYGILNKKGYALLKFRVTHDGN